MQFFRYTLNDWKYTITNPKYIFCVLLVVILNLCNSVYTGNFGKGYSTLDIIFSNDINIKNFNANDILLNNEISSYLIMFMPIIVSYISIERIHQEFLNNYIYYALYRLGDYTYFFGKLSSCILSGGFVLILGHIIFSIVVLSIFPIGELYVTNILKYYLGLFLFAGISSLLPYILIVLIKDFYLSICIPFIVQYVLNTALGKLISYFGNIGKFDSINYVYCWYPKTLCRAFYNIMNVIEYQTLIVNGIYLLIICSLLLILIKRKCIYD